MIIARLTALAFVAAALVSAARAQEGKPNEATVQHLMKDAAALKAALAHCDPKALTMDPDCAAGDEARRRLFFSNSPTYTPQKVDVFPHTPDLQPPPKPAPTATPSQPGAKQP